MSVTGAAKLVDIAITLALAGLERAAVVGKVEEMEAAGASADEITDALQAMRRESEAAAQKQVDATKDA